MNPIDMIPLLKTNNPEIGKSWADICREGQAKQEAWIASLREQGVRAAHPDDGWVNRGKSEVQFVYPQFMDGVNCGSIVAIGWPDRHRLVELTGMRTSPFGSQFWGFRSVDKPAILAGDAQ